MNSLARRIVVISGQTGAGKSEVTGLLTKQLIKRPETKVDIICGDST